MKAFFTLVFTALFYFCSAQQSKPDTLRVFIKFENSREQFGIKIDSNYYFVRYNRLVAVKKKVIGYRLIKK